MWPNSTNGSAPCPPDSLASTVPSESNHIRLRILIPTPSPPHWSSNFGGARDIFRSPGDDVHPPRRVPLGVSPKTGREIKSRPYRVSGSQKVMLGTLYTVTIHIFCEFFSNNSRSRHAWFLGGPARGVGDAFLRVRAATLGVDDACDVRHEPDREDRS